MAHALYGRVKEQLPSLVGEGFAGRRIATADDFAYTDPVDGSTSSGQGCGFCSTTAAGWCCGSPHRHPGGHPAVYLESYVPPGGALHQDPQAALADLIRAIDHLAEIRERTGMERPR